MKNEPKSMENEELTRKYGKLRKNLKVWKIKKEPESMEN